MRNQEWTPRQLVESLAAVPIEPIILSHEPQPACWLSHLGNPETGLVKWHARGPMVVPANIGWDFTPGVERVSKTHPNIYPIAAYPVLAARFAMEHDL